MKDLTKTQKGIVLISLFWLIIAFFLAYNERRHNECFEPRNFLALILPIILYWSGVWLFGFCYLLKFIKTYKSRIIRYCIFFILGFIGFSSINNYGWEIFNILKPKPEFSFTSSPTPEENATMDKYGHLYGIYYGAVEFPAKYCSEKGYAMTNLENFKIKHKEKINEINQQLNSVEAIKGFRQSKKFIELDKKALDSLLQVRTFLILEELIKENPKFSPHPDRVKNIVKENRDKVSMIDTCRFLNDNFNDWIKDIDWKGYITP